MYARDHITTTTTTTNNHINQYDYLDVPFHVVISLMPFGSLVLVFRCSLDSINLMIVAVIDASLSYGSWSGHGSTVCDLLSSHGTLLKHRTVPHTNRPASLSYRMYVIALFSSGGNNKRTA
jgi:hypothetical protein